MRAELECAPSYAMAYLTLAAGETAVVEPGATVAMSAGLEVAGGFGPGGVLKAAARRLAGGEGLLMARYTATIEGSWVAVAPRYPGDIAVLEVSPERPVLAQSGSFLAASETLMPSAAYAGVKMMLLHEGITALRLTGSGLALVASYGGLQRFALGPGEQLVVDTGHIVAWSEHTALRIGALSSVVTSAVTGEGLVGLFSGPGEVWIQTRAEQQLRGWLTPTRETNTR